MGIIEHDTDVMREWSTEVGTNLREPFDDLREYLNKTVENLVGSGYKGGTADQLNDKKEEMDTYFVRLSQTLEECAEFVSKTAAGIDEDTEMLSSRIKDVSIEA